MAKIQIVGIGDSIRILGVQQMSSRQRMKFNIFISALSDSSVKKEADDVEVLFESLDKHAMAKKIISVVAHLEKQGCSVVLNESIEALLREEEEFEAAADATLEKLNKIHSNDSDSQKDYSNFCAFCDENLKITLRDYQYKAAFLLSIGNGGFDFSVPGAGKTIISYAAYRKMRNDNQVDRMFVMGPGSSYNAWFDEYKTCFGEEPDFKNLSIESTATCKLYLKTSVQNHTDITFINTEKVRLLIKPIIEFMKKSRVLFIVDEAHKIKNPAAAVTTAVLEITKYASARIILTGTPMPNGYEDLYSLTRTFSPFSDILPYKYAQLRNMTKNDASPKETEKIRAAIRPYYSRISKKYLVETKELLPPVYRYVSCKMDPDQAELYERLDSFVGKLRDGIDEDFLMFFKKAALIRKMQISANPALLKKGLIYSMDELIMEYQSVESDPDSKMDQLIKADRELLNSFMDAPIAKIINRYNSGYFKTAKNRLAVKVAKQLVAEGKKVLVWDIFVKNMDVLKSMLEEGTGKTVEIIYGAVPALDRQDALRRFREGKSQILLANPATLAESISLHRVCQNAIYVNRNFNTAQFIQSKDRIHRINMPEGATATYYFLENERTVDECIAERLIKKEERMLSILDADDIEIGGAEMEDIGSMSSEDIDAAYMR